MAKEETSALASIQNSLLAALPPVALARILAKMTEVEMEFDTEIYKQGKKIENIYFPVSGIISLLASVDNGSTTEVGIVGREGMVGLPVFLGEKESFVTAVVQGMGSAMQISAEDFQDECAAGDLDRVMRRFANSMLVQISQSAVCFRFHVIEQRLARWLLMTSDRMEALEFRVTQTFLSNMLGVRREAVNRAAKSLEANSFIKNRRSSITISDRKGLESAACVCYDVIRAEESRVSAMRR
jgi:CRP-like cAMP-binding protein